MADDKIQLLRRFGLHASADELERKQQARRMRCRCTPPNICPACVPQAYQRKEIKR